MHALPELDRQTLTEWLGEDEVMLDRPE